ncbi:MAG TPA: class I SAM-dependent methyltransferase [Actinomycetota bacterium]|nr:class I SAM-dependent methyltransferase [Actinomycetota bacterium]
MDVDWLTSDEGRCAIAALVGVDPLRARSLLPGVSPEHVSDALTQARHRPADFPLPLVTVDGVQQASPVEVATRRARRMAEEGVGTVIDAGCGIGLDSWAFARAGLRVVAFEVDSPTAAVARANLAGLDVEVRNADVTTADLPAGALLYVDPARRREHRDAQGRPLRIHDPAQWRPAWQWVLDQTPHRSVVARIRPGHRDLPAGAEWHCTSVGRRLVDATVWFPPLARVERRATVLAGTEAHELVGVGASPPVGEVGRCLIDPDPAIVRSGLLDEAAATVSGRLIDEHLAFITTDAEPAAWLGRSMAVLGESSLKAVPAVCRRLGVRSATVWARGFDPAPSISVPEGRDAVVVAARLGPGRRAAAWVGRRVH